MYNESINTIPSYKEGKSVRIKNISRKDTSRFGKPEIKTDEIYTPTQRGIFFELEKSVLSEKRDNDIAERLELKQINEDYIIQQAIEQDFLNSLNIK